MPGDLCRGENHRKGDNVSEAFLLPVLAAMMGALALWLKRVQQVTNLGQFVLLFLVMVLFENWGVVWGAQFVFPIVLGVGLLAFHLTIGKVKRLGTLGWYGTGAPVIFANHSESVIQVS